MIDEVHRWITLPDGWQECVDCGVARDHEATLLDTRERLAEAERLLKKCLGDDSKHEMGLYELALNDGPRWTSEADAIRDAVDAFLKGGST